MRRTLAQRSLIFNALSPYGCDRKLSAVRSDELFVLKQPGLWPRQTARKEFFLGPNLQANR